MRDPQSPSQDVDDLAELARRLSERGRYEEAAELFMLALRLDPKNLSVKLGLAEARKLQTQQRGGTSRSLKEMMRESFRRNAIDAAHFLGLAHLYAEKGENARAIECLEIAKAKDLANPSHHKLHGRLLFRRKDYDGAAEEFARALRLNPFDRETAESLGRTEYDRKQFEPALRASVHAFLLIHEADVESVERLRRRIQTLKQILGWGNRELAAAFRERKEHLHTAFDRLEWHRERFLEQGGLTVSAILPSPPSRRTEGGSRIEQAARLRRIRAWTHLTDEQVFRLTQTVEEEVHDTGSLVLGYRSQGRDLYVLERGEIAVQRSTSYGTFGLGRLQAGDVFGESSFITGHERSSDAVATKPCQILRIDAERLDQVVESYPDLGVQLYWSLWHSLAHKLRNTNEQLKTFFSDEALPENFLRLRKQPSAGAAPVKVEANDKIRLFREQGLSRRELMTL
ncbi:MAG TPA: cyclic nucleotide-binding domain-containing protein, partial [Thermoanaerobaculia bacterium]|nr:cyclic nucleotide-binding domain-containing protein [Thermoanaerobaculia bacterium]